jgi:hypothetical protein
MSRLSETATPKYCNHKATGQAYVCLSGKTFYLGKYGSAASKAEYNRRIAEWLAAGRRLPSDPNETTIAEVVAAFRRHAKTYYCDQDGTVSRNHNHQTVRHSASWSFQFPFRFFLVALIAA